MPPLTCPTCGGSLSAMWPYLTLKSYSALEHNITDWRLGSNAGCALCEVVTMVVEDVLINDRYTFGTEFDYNYGPVKDNHFYLEGRGNTSIRVIWGMKHDKHVLILEFVAKILDVATGPDIVTVYPEEKNLIFEHFEHISENRDSPQALGRSRKWLSICDHHHPKCQLPIDDSIPERLLEIEKNQLKLQMNPDANSKYVALSHCWGGTQPIRLLGHNISQYQEGIPIHKIPRNLQEAVEVVRELGFRYLWIDSLCIIQDSSEDWEKQSSLMVSTYGNADLVLAATAAASTEEGFIHSTKPAYFEEHRLLMKNDGHNERHIRYRLISQPHTDGPLDSRAWAYQESLVSRRYLSYGSREMLWHCRETEFTETDWHYSHGRHGLNLLSRNLERLLESVTNEISLMSYWHKEIVPRYTSKSLTRQSDILVALSAIAEAFYFRTNWTYLAGIWKEDLLRSLTWVSPVLCTPRNADCPSWSWASLDTGPMASILNTEHHVRKELANVIEASTSLVSSNIFGSVSDGLIRIRGPYTLGTLLTHTLTVGAVNFIELKVPTVSMKSKIEAKLDTPIARTIITLAGGKEEGSVRRVAHGEEPDKTIGCHEGGQVLVYILLLFTATEAGSGNFGIVTGLLIGRLSSDPGYYQRVGICSFKFADEDRGFQFQDMVQGMKYQEFTIV